MAQVQGVSGFVAETRLTAASDVNSSLQGIVTTGLLQGSGCFVQENQSYYMLYPADVQVPNNTTIVAATGGGNWIFQFALGAGPTSGLFPDVIWVDANSASALENGSPNAPFKTIQAAIDATSAGVRSWIWIARGVYAEAPVVPAGALISFWALAVDEVVVTGAWTITTAGLSQNVSWHGVRFATNTLTCSAPTGAVTRTYWFDRCQDFSWNSAALAGDAHTVGISGTRAPLIGDSSAGTITGAPDATTVRAENSLITLITGCLAVRLDSCTIASVQAHGAGDVTAFVCDGWGANPQGVIFAAPGGNFNLDGFTNYHFKTNGSVLTNGSKVITDDLVP